MKTRYPLYRKRAIPVPFKQRNKQKSSKKGQLSHRESGQTINKQWKATEVLLPGKMSPSSEP